MAENKKYERVLLKLSGQTLGGKLNNCFDFNVVDELCLALKKLQEKKIKLALVFGGGNIWRYRDYASEALDRVSSDQIGILATIINGLLIKSRMVFLKMPVELFSAIEMSELCEPYSVRNAMAALDRGKIVIIAGGTGNPFFTTDSAAALRALELKCDALLKATKVEGVYDMDPEKNPQAKFYSKITFDQALEKNLQVMDAAAISLCRDNKLPLHVFSIKNLANIEKVIRGEKIGTKIVF